MMRTVSALAVLILLTGAGNAVAQTVPPCPDTGGIATAQYPDAVPAPIVADFGGRYTPFALPNENFDPAEVGVAGIKRRLMWVKHRNDRWVVAYEQGGDNYSDHVLLYVFTKGDLTARPKEDHVAGPNTVCGVADGLLDDSEY